MSNNAQRQSLIVRIAQRFGVDPNKLYDTLKTTCFRQRDGSAPSNEQMMSLLIVADQYGLNPFTKEIVAFSGMAGQIVPVVSVDGWCRIINSHPHMDGVEFNYSETTVTPKGGQSCPEWVEAIIYRKDRNRPTRVREYLDEVYQPARKYPGPWQTHTKRMMRHKTLIQAGRVAFGFSGIFDADEADRILTQPLNTVTPQSQNLLSAEELDANAERFRKRALQIGYGPVEALIRERYKGNELDYMLAAIQAKPVIEHEKHNEPIEAEVMPVEPGYVQEHNEQPPAEEWDEALFY